MFSALRWLTVLVLTAQASFALGETGYSLGAGLFNLSSHKSAEVDKSGWSAPIEASWRQPLGDFFFTVSAGLDIISISGSGSGASQSVFQDSFTSEQNAYYRFGSFGAGLGVRHLLGPGSGLEFSSSSSGFWTILAGPRFFYETDARNWFVSAAWDQSLGLAVGTANVLMLNVGYVLNPEPRAEAQTAPSPTPIQTPTPAPVETPAPELAMASPTPAPEPGNDRTFKVPQEALARNWAGTNLLRRTVRYLRELAVDLTYSHPSDWSKLNVACPNEKACEQMSSALIANGIGSPKIEPSIHTDSSEIGLQIETLNFGMMGYLETKQRQWSLRQRSVLELEVLTSGEARMSATERARVREALLALARAPDQWTDPVCLLPKNLTGRGAAVIDGLIREIQGIARSVGLGDMEFAPSGSQDNSGRIVLRIEATTRD